MAELKKMEVHLDTASCYKIEGWAWCPQTPETRVQVRLLASDGACLAQLPADRARKDLEDMAIGDSRYGFEFYGLLRGVAAIELVGMGESTEKALDIVPPTVPAYLADNAAYCDYFANCGFYLIHPDDFLFRFNIGRTSLERCVHDYLSAGKAIADMLKAYCMEYMKVDAPPYALLDFASGFGRVSRAFDRDYFNITASDIHEYAMRFIPEQAPGVNTLQSKTKPQDFTSENAFDVIFCLSFFTHMPDTTFGDWLVALYKVLKPGGLLVFTAHGRVANARVKIPLKDGFGFWASSEQRDLDAADYGQTISELSYVVRVLGERIGQTPVLFQEGAEIGSGNQDLYIVRKAQPGEGGHAEEDMLISRATLEAALEEQRAAFQNSTSWKLTKPVRAIKALFGKGKM